MRALWLFLSLLFCSSVAPRVNAAEFQGADVLLKRLAEPPATLPPARPAVDVVAQLKLKLTAFEADAGTLAPEEAARQWLALFDAFSALPAKVVRASGSRDPLNVVKFLRALPPAAAWGALARALDERAGGGRELRDAALRAFAAVLRNDGPARRRVFEALSTTVAASKMDPGQKQNLQEQLEALTDWLAMETGSDAERLTIFEKQLAAWEQKNEQNDPLTVPALIKLAGQEKTGALLRRVVLRGADFEIQDEPTRQAAAAMALQNLAELKKPLWSLVSTVEDAALYEAFVKRFPTDDSASENARKQVDPVYLVALIAKNRTKDAAKFISERRDAVVESGSLLNSAMTAELVRRGLIKQVHGVLRELLETDAALPFWTDFIQMSARLGESDRALAFLREVAARPQLAPEARRVTSGHYADALLAADQVEEGLSVLREIIKAGPRAGQRDEDAAVEEIQAQYEKLGVPLSPEVLAQLGRKAAGAARSGMNEHVRQCLKLARLGRLLEKPDVVEEGLAAARGALAQARSEVYESRRAVESIAQFLVETGRGPEAEAIVAEEIVRIVRTPATARRYDRNTNASELLGVLAAIYHRSERPADVLRLFEAAPLWPASDLAELPENKSLNVPTLFMGAKALAAAGKTEEARRAVERTIENHAGYDPAYRLLLDLGGAGREAWLQAAAQRDRFEERPLIWLAQLQLETGRNDDAEKTVRAAIAIDPSDGEQGKGDRMRAYAVLGDILEKKGDAAQARTMRGAVAAIRISEKADDWWSVGLLTRAVKMYEEALGHFADAYCIQSRLALRYSELGDYPKAELHYQRAYELMPESFGRIESHCFGCERAFNGERAQSIAERVFTQLATKLPDKAQVFYLLGYLREEQERGGEAAAEFRKAVKLDPDYFNAWQKLLGLREAAALAPRESEAAVFALLRLDPTLQHHSASFDSVRDLRGLWSAVLAAEKAQPVRENGPILSLTAAKAARERLAAARLAARGNQNAEPEEEKDFAQARQRDEDLRQQFANHALMQRMGYLLEGAIAP